MSMNPYDVKVSVVEFCNALKDKTHPNEYPYKNQIIELNNANIQRFRREILENVADEQGNVTSGKSWVDWEIFQNGINVRAIMSVWDNVPRTNPENLKFWIEFLRQDVEALIAAGKQIVNYAWTTVNDAVFLKLIEEEMQHIYTTDDPAEWIRLSHKFAHILKGDMGNQILVENVAPFTDEEILDIRQKVSAVMSTIVNFPNETVVTLEKLRSLIVMEPQDRPYFRKSKEFTKTLFSTFLDEYLVQVINPKEKVISTQMVAAMWSMFMEGYHLEQYKIYKPYFTVASEKEIDWWVNFLQRDIAELHPYYRILSMGLEVIVQSMRRAIAEYKIDNVFYSKDATTILENDQKFAEKVQEVVQNVTKLDKDTFNDISQKVYFIANTRVKPK